MEFLSDIELYYSTDIRNDSIIISGDEKNHASRVMRHSVGDRLYVTDGKGRVFQSVIKDIQKDILVASTEQITKYINSFSNYFFCIPRLKNPERFEFVLEKCTELGITNFIIYDAARSVSKGIKKDRWEKIVISAMKQSLRAFKPEIVYMGSLSVLNNYEGTKIVLEQKADNFFSKEIFSSTVTYYFIFGPEGGLDEKEIISLNNHHICRISENRLRSETAIIKTASLLTI